jgi:hypothetical protein
LEIASAMPSGALGKIGNERPAIRGPFGGAVATRSFSGNGATVTLPAPSKQGDQNNFGRLRTGRLPLVTRLYGYVRNVRAQRSRRKHRHDSCRH